MTKPKKRKQGIFGSVAPTEVPTLLDLKIQKSFADTVRELKHDEFDPYFDRDCWGDY